MNNFRETRASAAPDSKKRRDGPPPVFATGCGICGAPEGYPVPRPPMPDMGPAGIPGIPELSTPVPGCSLQQEQQQTGRRPQQQDLNRGARARRKHQRKKTEAVKFENRSSKSKVDRSMRCELKFNLELSALRLKVLCIAN